MKEFPPKNKNLPTRPGIATHSFSIKSQNPVMIPFGLVMMALAFLFFTMIAFLGLAAAGVSMLFGKTKPTATGYINITGGRKPGETPFSRDNARPSFMPGREDDVIDVEAVEITDEREKNEK